jgi:trehalose 6-phosphate synthase
LLNGGEGVLVLSHEAGAWEELSESALGVNPFDVAGTADTLHRALSMDPAERRTRAAQLRAVVVGRTAADWLEDQLSVAATPFTR